MITKEWKNIKGYESLYKVSNYGEIKSKRRVIYGYIDGELQPSYIKREQLLKPIDHGNGYLYITLTDENGNKKNHYIHRLVAEAFLDNPDNLPQVNHIDYDRRNNRLYNLEWVSVSENAKHSLCNQPKTRKCCHTNTGYKYISRRKNGKYRFSMPLIDGKRREKCFDNIFDALSFRNQLAEEFGFAIKDNY